MPLIPCIIIYPYTVSRFRSELRAEVGGSGSETGWEWEVKGCIPKGEE